MTCIIAPVEKVVKNIISYFGLKDIIKGKQMAEAGLVNRIVVKICK